MTFPSFVHTFIRISTHSSIHSFIYASIQLLIRPTIHQPPIHSSPVHQPPIHSSPIHQPPIHSSPIHQPPIHSSPIHQPPIHSPTMRGAVWDGVSVWLVNKSIEEVCRVDRGQLRQPGWKTGGSVLRGCVLHQRIKRGRDERES